MTINKKYAVVFFLVFSQLIGSCFLLSRHFEEEFTNDAHSYVEMSHGNYDVTITHRYRFVIPVLAGCVSSVFDAISESIWKKERPALWNDKLGFLFVNVTIITITSVVLFSFIELFGFGFLASFIGTLAYTSSFHTIYNALPSTDSLYHLAIVWWLWALKKESFTALLLSSIVGILAKEAFFLFLPLVFWTENIAVFKKGLIALSVAATYLLVRSMINQLVPASNIEEGISNALYQFSAFKDSLQRIFSVQGILEFLSVYTFFYIPVIWSIKHYHSFIAKTPKYLLLIFPIVTLHVLLSTELPRMWLYTFPIIALGVAHCFEKKIYPLILAEQAK